MDGSLLIKDRGSLLTIDNESIFTIDNGPIMIDRGACIDDG